MCNIAHKSTAIGCSTFPKIRSIRLEAWILKLRRRQNLLLAISAFVITRFTYMLMLRPSEKFRQIFGFTYTYIFSVSSTF